MKIAIDAMGGDHAPEAIVAGAEAAVSAFSDFEVTLIGDEEQIRSHLTDSTRIEIIHTKETIQAGEGPVRAVRRKKNASMVLMMKEVKEGRADACISAGNTGALMTAGLFWVGRVKGIHRPGLASTMPTVDGKGFLLLDVGANPDARAEHLVQYASMGTIYVEQVRGVSNPRVGLLNVGTEEGKGNNLSKNAYSLLSEAPIRFIGNVESRDLMEGAADVVVCDGFSGNLVLKSMEGTALSLFSLIKEEMMKSWLRKMAAAVLKPGLKQIKNRVDYAEYGGAALFGLASPVIKAHGSSDGRAVFSAFRQARDIVRGNVVSNITSTFLKNREQNGEV